MGCSEEKLIAGTRSGDADAFTELVRRHERPVRAWVVSRCPPGGDADDVSQRTFIEAFKNIDRYKPGTDFRAWLFSIARFQLLAEVTRLKRVADYHSRYAPRALSDELTRRASSLDADEKLPALEHCLKTLGPAGRCLLDWRYSDELPLAEIASRAGRSVAAIKKSLFKLRRELHDCVTRRLAGGGA